jgi:hypothetical protein
MLPVLMLFHLLFYPLGLIKDLPLNGFYKLPDTVAFTAENYFSHRFQDSNEVRINQSMGLFPGLTRIHHQIEYSFFDRVHAHDVYKGKNAYLFRYCEGCLSDRTYPSPGIDHFMILYKRFQDSLEAQGKTVVWVIGPDKAFVYNEYLPGDLKLPVNFQGFYWSLKESLKKNGVNYIDFNELAYREKNKYPFRSFYRGGVHWTQAYAARCFDSVCRFLESKHFADIRYSMRTHAVNQPWANDIDMERSANLLIPLEDTGFYNVEIIPDSLQKKKKLLLVGDSFCYPWVWPHQIGFCFAKGSEFWYYNRERDDLFGNPIKNVDHKNMRKQIKDYDLFIILFNPLNAEYIDYDFISDVYDR